MPRMGSFLEVLVTLLPAEAGGRSRPIAPREGNYRPAVRVGADAPALPVRFIEGPPTIAPGNDARALVELETDVFDDADLLPGAELDLVEREQVVGIVTVARVWREAV